MKILLFDLAGMDYPGGCEKYFANLSKHLSQDNTVYVSESSQYFSFMNFIYKLLFGRRKIMMTDVKRDTGKSIRLDIKLAAVVPYTKSNRELKKLLFEIDKIYAKNEFQELFLLYYLLGRKNYLIKVIVGVHSAIFIPNGLDNTWTKIHNFQYNSRLYRHLLKSAKLVHVLNKDYIGLITARFGINIKKIMWIPNPIDWSTKVSSAKNGGLKILWIGRLTNEKGLDRLSNIIELLSSESDFRKYTFYIGGEGEGENIVKNLADRYSNIKYLGFVKNIDLLYKKTDISIFTAHFDTFAHAVLEPQSLGIPVISYNIPGPKDIIINNKTGYLVNTEKELVSSIIKLFSKKNKNIKKFNMYKRSIFLLTNRRFSKKKIFRKLESLFV